MDTEIRELLELQSGVIARHQALAAGMAEHDIRRMLRRREWATVHPGVYVDHTGPLTFLQRAWAAVLLAWPAALCHETAIRIGDGPGRRDGDDEVIHVAVDRDRAFRAPDGVIPHRLADLDAKVQWNLSPPRVRIEHAVLDVAAEAPDELLAIAAMSDAVRARRTTAARLLKALSSRSRIPRRPFLQSVLRDVAEGTCSVLEHGYLDRVERAHGLPAGQRQVRESSRGPLYRDAEYRDFGLIVELDGRLFHTSVQDRDRDLDRDLDAAIDGRDTVRLGWGQVYPRACATAEKLGMLLAQRGWEGTPIRCPECPDRDGGDSQPPDDWRSPLSA